MGGGAKITSCLELKQVRGQGLLIGNCIHVFWFLSQTNCLGGEERRGDVERGRSEQQPQGEAPLLPTSLHLPVPRERRQTTNKR